MPKKKDDLRLDEIMKNIEEQKITPSSFFYKEDIFEYSRDGFRFHLKALNVVLSITIIIMVSSIAVKEYKSSKIHVNTTDHAGNIHHLNTMIK